MEGNTGGGQEDGWEGAKERGREGGMCSGSNSDGYGSSSRAGWVSGQAGRAGGLVCEYDHHLLLPLLPTNRRRPVVLPIHGRTYIAYRRGGEGGGAIKQTNKAPLRKGGMTQQPALSVTAQDMDGWMEPGDGRTRSSPAAAAAGRKERVSEEERKGLLKHRRTGG